MLYPVAWDALLATVLAGYLLVSNVSLLTNHLGLLLLLLQSSCIILEMVALTRLVNHLLTRPRFPSMAIPMTIVSMGYPVSWTPSICSMPCIEPCAEPRLVSRIMSCVVSRVVWPWPAVVHISLRLWLVGLVDVVGVRCGLGGFPALLAAESVKETTAHFRVVVEVWKKRSRAGEWSWICLLR